MLVFARVHCCVSLSSRWPEVSTHRHSKNKDESSFVAVKATISCNKLWKEDGQKNKNRFGNNEKKKKTKKCFVRQSNNHHTTQARAVVDIAVCGVGRRFVAGRGESRP